MMARPLRVEFPGAIYHVTVRGNARADIFLDDRDRERFLERLRESIETHEVRLYLFCLMTNHVHLVVETPHGNLWRFVHSVLTGYGVYFNLRHGRSGHVTAGPYKAKVVEGDAYLLALTRYVHLNPVHTRGMAKRPLKERRERLRRYRWSSYRSYVGMEQRWAFVDYGPVLAQAGGRRRGEQERNYRRFVEAGLAETDEEFRDVLAASPRAIGGEGFRRWVEELYEAAGEKRKTEDVAYRRVGERLEVGEILEVVAKGLKVERNELSERRRDSYVRPIAAKLLCRYGGLTQRQAAEVLGLGTGAAVSCQLRKLAEGEGKDRAGRRLGKQVEKLEEELKERLGGTAEKA